MRREKGSRILGDARHARRVAGPGRHESGEPGVAHPDARPQIVGQRAQQRVHRPVLTAVQALKSIQADVGDAQARALDAVAGSLQRGEHTVEHPLVGRLVGFEDD